MVDHGRKAQDRGRRQRTERQQRDDAGRTEHPAAEARRLALPGELCLRELDLVPRERRDLLREQVHELAHGSLAKLRRSAVWVCSPVTLSCGCHLSFLPLVYPGLPRAADRLTPTGAGRSVYITSSVGSSHAGCQLPPPQRPA